MDRQKTTTELDVVPGITAYTVDADTQAFLDRFPHSPDTLAAYRAFLPECLPHPEEFQVEIDFIAAPEPHAGTFFRLIRPRQRPARLPVMAYFHGGGWQRDAAHSHDRWLYQLAARAGIAIASLDDAFSDETGMASRIDLSEQMIRNLMDEAIVLELDAACLTIGGDGLGGRLAASFSLAICRRRGLAVQALVLICPLIFETRTTTSGEQYGSGPLMTAAVVRYFLEIQTSDPASSSIPASRVVARLLGNAPPTLIITAEHDLLRDDGEDYARTLMAAGANVSAQRYIGTIHGFPIIDALADSSPARAALEQVVATLTTAASGRQG